MPSSVSMPTLSFQAAPSTMGWHSLPDLAHAVVALFLPEEEAKQLMYLDRRMLKASDEQVREVVLCCPEGNRPRRGNETKPPGVVWRHSVLRLLNRFSCVRHVTICDWRSMKGLAQALSMGHCQNLEVLNLDILNHTVLNPRNFTLLVHQLAQGRAPKLSTLHLPYLVRDAYVVKLAKAFDARCKAGHPGLRSLVVKRCPDNVVEGLLALLSSEACSRLEEIELGASDSEGSRKLLRHLIQTGAPSLRVLKAGIGENETSLLLSTEGFAPHLESLHLSIVACPGSSVPGLPGPAAIRVNQWPKLQELRVGNGGLFSKNRFPVYDQLEAIIAGRVQLRSLVFKGVDESSSAQEGMMGHLLAEALLDPAFSKLEELELSQMSHLGNGAATSLSVALDHGLACSSTLRKLRLDGCGFTSAGVRDLVNAIARNPLTALTCLDLSYSEIADMAAIALFMALVGGGLPRLEELYLEGVIMGKSWVKVFKQLRGEKACACLRHLVVDPMFEDAREVAQFFADFPNLHL